MNSIDILKNIYKPYKYTKIGNVTFLETTSGNFVVKKKNKNIKELYNYLANRHFFSYPKLIDDSRDEVNVFEYVSDTNIPKEQKCEDMIEVIASLHNKTCYFKEVSNDKYKSIYDDIKNNIIYLKNFYNIKYEKVYNETYQSPSNYAFITNYSKIVESLNFCEKELDEWLKLVENEDKIRVSIVHNNLELKHFIENDNGYLISWDKYAEDTPVIDIVNLYKKEYRSINFSEILKKYFYIFPLLEYEKKLFFILISLPDVIEDNDNEFKRCINTSKVLDYIYKTEKLISPYYTENKEIE